jgi:hypothetical protein
MGIRSDFSKNPTNTTLYPMYPMYPIFFPIAMWLWAYVSIAYCFTVPVYTPSFHFKGYIGYIGYSVVLIG